MNVRILYFWVILSVLLCSLQSCQTEELYVKEKDLGKKSGITTEYLKGDEAIRIARMLKTKFNNLGVNSQQQSVSRTDYQEIDYNNILLVVDSLGVRNYIFRVTNHPEDNYKTFHNLVMTDKNGELELTLMKYAMTDTFAQEYQEQLKKFEEFKGTITSKKMLQTNPCEDIEADFTSPTNGDPDSGSGGGGIGGTVDDPVGGSGSAPGGSDNTNCIEVSLTVICQCKRSYSSWENYLTSMCGDGSNPGYDVTLVVTYTDVCQMGTLRCAPDGAIGVIDEEKDCNTFDKRVNNIIDAEGGFSFDPIDPGGATNKGISWKVWQANAESILGIEPNIENLEMLTNEQAKAMYKVLYWNKIKCDEITDGDLRYLLFDFYVNAGSNAIITLKKTLNSLGYNLTLNGLVDDNLINLINAHQDQINLYNSFKSKRVNYYNNLVNASTSRYIAKYPNATSQQLLTNTLKKFQNGWLNRANKFINKTIQNSKNVNC
ncbi:glycoside hydrolase family 108 protein [Flavobacterium sp.]|jgi:lysozyme family protein|uniref:glycoside hydrolase family 108 protein n=1 Tax=Flavobacterium sp. TaxID=239 RepID=UPI0037C0FE7D